MMGFWLMSSGRRSVTIVIAAAPTAVPTMQVWGVGVLALALGALGLRQTRRRGLRG